MGLINKFFLYLKKTLITRMKENRRIKKIERGAFLKEREKAAKEIGKKKAHIDPYERFRM